MGAWHATCLHKGEGAIVLSPFRDYVTPGGRNWLPLASVLGSIAIVAYADFARLHQWSVTLEAAILLFGVIVLCLEVRRN